MASRNANAGSNHRSNDMLRSEVISVLSLFWRIFWKVTALSTVLSFVGFLIVLGGDLAGQPFVKVVLAVAILLAYCLFYSFWVGVTVAACILVWQRGGTRLFGQIARALSAVFAAAWRVCGGWIIVTLVGTGIGAIAGIAIAVEMLRDVDFRGAGLHGGGEIMLGFMLAIFAASAAVGAIVGGVVFGIPALIVVMTTRFRRSAHEQISARPFDDQTTFRP